MEPVAQRIERFVKDVESVFTERTDICPTQCLYINKSGDKCGVCAMVAAYVKHHPSLSIEELKNTPSSEFSNWFTEYYNLQEYGYVIMGFDQYDWDEQMEDTEPDSDYAYDLYLAAKTMADKYFTADTV